MQNYKSLRDITNSRLNYLSLVMISVLMIRSVFLHSQSGIDGKPVLIEQSGILTGAQQAAVYLPLLAGKSIGVVCNQTSLIGDIHLIDTLLSSGIDIRVIFAPEHGLFGNTEAGKLINDTTDHMRNMDVISLYGSKKKPDPVDLQSIDLVLFDIQDVGARFYTYISTLALVMEACAESGIPMIILDRPNPNGFYVDGPVLDTTLRSFVGMHPVPIVYGMTIGEYALMVNGEGWLPGSIKCDLTVIPLKNWARNMIVKLPVRPSPNLPNWQSIYLYPALCLFEGTAISVGRGTDMPFQVVGHPMLLTESFVFTPRKIPGVADNPPLIGKDCYGQLLTGYAENYDSNDHPLTLWLLLSYYKLFKTLNLEDQYFTGYFDKLAGTQDLRKQAESGLPEEEIRKSWREGIDLFLEIREKYLLYPDYRWSGSGN